ncbi:MAG: aldolase catalytic domain-containing protein [Elusimicrobia bacterium]|nr:aldolase catalytic domain-containing protein [Elusimicrobiota bacterium]
MRPLHVLDCTFRDGGYYNNWDFPSGLVEQYLAAMAASHVDVVEIGFRFLAQPRFLGAHAYSSDDFLKTLPRPRGLKFAVMVNADELLKHAGGPDAAVDRLFKPASSSPVSLVRIAAHFADLPRCAAIAKRLKGLGYAVAVNLMQAGGKSAAAVTAAAKVVRSWKVAETLYFADSLGNMPPDEIAGIVKALRAGWGGPLGIHAHNNMGQALANTIAAVDAGASWADATVLGMGRGAGNVPTEYLLLELQRRAKRPGNLDPLFALALGPFARLQRDFGWGPSLLYYLSAVHGIHPTYVQTMLGKGHYSPDQVIAAVESLRAGDASSYSGTRLEEALHSDPGSSEGTWTPRGWAKGRPVLLVAAGPSLKHHGDALRRFIAREKPLVLALNAIESLPPHMVDAYAACHKVSLLMDAERYRTLGRPLIVPKGRIPKELHGKLAKVKLLDYGMGLARDTVSVGETGCVLPSPMSAGYTLAVAEVAGAPRVWLAGFDGYEASDPRQHDMNDMLRRYTARPGALPLTAMTPTTFELPQGSLYAPAS